MSFFERNDYEWRETYFVFFEISRRPTFKQLEKVLNQFGQRFEITHRQANEAGQIESLSLISAHDFSAVDLIFAQGTEVLEQAASLARELKSPQLEQTERQQLERLSKLDGRFDLLHFGQIKPQTARSSDPRDLDSELIDPSALLLVFDTLIEITRGVGVDPASGSLS